MRDSREALDMMINSKRRLIDEMKKTESEEIKEECGYKIDGLNIAIDILANKY